MKAKLTFLRAHQVMTGLVKVAEAPKEWRGEGTATASGEKDTML